MQLVSKILIYIRNKINEGLLEVSYDNQKKILTNLGTPKDIFERSYFQYKCQMTVFTLIDIFVLNLISIVPLIILLLKRKSVNDINNEYDTAFITAGVSSDILPEELISKTNQIIEFQSKGKSKLSKSDKNYIFKNILKSYWYSPYFVYKVSSKIGRYSVILDSFAVSNITTYLEFSFASSILTDYCRSRNVKHINVMHGEKLFNIRDSYIEFDEFYVWDEYYMKLFQEMQANVVSYKIELPRSITSIKIKSNNLTNNATYYLAYETNEELTSIKENLKSLDSIFDKIIIRYHPRYADKNLIMELFKNFEIEDPREVKIEDSFNRTNYIISLYSTVLFQAHKLGKKIIIDDISKPEKLKKLSDLKYMMLNEPHLLLSDMIREKSKK